MHETATISEGAQISNTATVWHLAQIREGAQIGENCVIGRGAYVGPQVTLGNNCKVQNYALIYEPAVLEDGVFVGPAAVLTNDEFPRAVNPDESLKSASDWRQVGVYVKRGASIGANATCVAPVVIGEWALVGAGAVVTKDVPNFALVVGTPARRICWVGKSGLPLEVGLEPGLFVCPSTGTRYREITPSELVEELPA